MLFFFHQDIVAAVRSLPQVFKAKAHVSSLDTGRLSGRLRTKDLRNIIIIILLRRNIKIIMKMVITKNLIIHKITVMIIILFIRSTGRQHGSGKNHILRLPLQKRIYMSH